MKKILAVALFSVIALSGCGGDDDSDPAAATPPPSPSPTRASAPATTAPAATLGQASPDAVLAARALRREAAAFSDAFNAWVTGGSGAEAAAVARAAAEAAEELSSAATGDGATDVAAAADDYAAYFTRAAVLVGEGETAYAGSEAAEGDLDCFKQRAFDRWTGGAAVYLGPEYAEPPVGREGVCDEGYGSS